jgi:DNA end-binding protein Ku
MATRPRKTAREKERQHARPSGLRPFWSGTLSFGLVSVPVDIYSATRSEGIALRMLAPDGTPLQRRYFDPETNRDLAYEDLVRGYEVGKGEHVVLTDEELDSVAPRKTRDIDLRLFVDADELDPVYFERSYVMVPAGDSTKPYRLLAEVMEKDGKAGIATAVMRNKEYVIAILAEKGVLRAETLRFAAELRSPTDVGLGKPHQPAANLVRSFEREIDKAAKPNVPASELADRRTEKLRALIESKRDRGKDVIQAPEVADDTQESDEPDAEDLFETIRKSLATAGKARASSGHSTTRSRSPTPSSTPARKHPLRRLDGSAHAARKQRPRRARSR